MESNKEILLILEKYLKENPNIRFGQALFNLGITEFSNKIHPEFNNFTLRDMYNDTDIVILNRISNKILNIKYDV